MFNVSTGYPISMTGIQGGGKKTLRDGLVARFPRFEPVELHLLKLGRMVDLEGLQVFRDRYREQDRLVRDIVGRERLAVTSRLGILDVALVASVMAGLGKIEQDGVEAFLEEVEADVPAMLFPSTLAAVTADAATLQQRLAARDEGQARKPSRGARALAFMAGKLEDVYVRGAYPHPVVEHMVEPYRRSGTLLLVDTAALDEAEALGLVAQHLEDHGAVSGPAQRLAAPAEGR
ncbi:MAG TPA: hypothetical protein VII47_14110 [Actinomycetota bacterium]